jgi:hypothetical protein
VGRRRGERDVQGAEAPAGGRVSTSLAAEQDWLTRDSVEELDALAHDLVKMLLTNYDMTDLQRDSVWMLLQCVVAEKLARRVTHV